MSVNSSSFVLDNYKSNTTGYARIDEIQKNAVKIIHLTQKNLKDASPNAKAYAEASEKRIAIIANRARSDYNIAFLDGSKSDSLDKNAKKIRARLLKEVGQELAEYNARILTDHAAKGGKSVEAEGVKHLALNTATGRMIRYAAKLSKINPWRNPEKQNKYERSVNAFKKAVEDLDEIGKKEYDKELSALKSEQILHKGFNTEDKDNLNLVEADHSKALARRANIVGVKGVYLAGAVFSAAKGVKQILSLVAQEANQKLRKVLKPAFEINVTHNKTKYHHVYETEFVPLNKHFDTKIAAIPGSKITTNKYSELYGERGAGSANREVEHVINAYLSTLNSLDPAAGTEGAVKKVNQVLRHGILAMRFETDPEKRHDVANQMARELLTAAALITLAESGKTLQEVSEQQKIDGVPLRIGVLSVSLVTPDMFLSGIEEAKNLFRKDKLQSSEAAMWRSQSDAFAENKNLELRADDGTTINVEFDIIPFNTGVNAGAVNFGAGTLEQWKGVRDKVDQMEKMIKNIFGGVDVKTWHPEIGSLLSDIQTLTETPVSYLMHENQYELGAKIEILANRLADHVKEKAKTGGGHYHGIAAFVNCMSAKDRTGVALAVAYTFEEMHKILGYYPTTKDMEDPDMQDLFVNIYAPLLLSYGGTFITEQNTDVDRYKVGKEVIIYKNAKAWQNKADLFFKNFRGLTGTTGG